MNKNKLMTQSLFIKNKRHTQETTVYYKKKQMYKYVKLIRFLVYSKYYLQFHKDFIYF
jgi:hypothetical protein